MGLYTAKGSTVGWERWIKGDLGPEGKPLSLVTLPLVIHISGVYKDYQKVSPLFVLISSDILKRFLSTDEKFIKKGKGI